MKHLYNTILKDRSRLLRHNQTETERLLWSKLRSRQLVGCKFYRQYPIGNYIIDFYCFEKKLAIELDGSQHLKQRMYDEKRSEVLRAKGITLLRFWDNEVFQNTNSVLEVIIDALIK